MDVVTRFAPSPTGHLHAGNYRTAVFAYLFARHNKGKFILRVEDTDRARSKKEYEENIIETLEWLGLEYDLMERQSDRVGEHKKALHELVDKGLAYVSKETNEEGIERELIRFRNSNKDVTFNDSIRGEITFNTTELKDFVIAKSFTEPIFHLVNVVDDHQEGVTHVIRGEDHVSNTPRQILIYEALGYEPPKFAHLPLILAKDKSKLSKRKGARPLLEYRDLGYLPEALINYLAFLGWHPGTDEELFSKDELVERFTLEQVQKSGAIFDEVKLRWYNREYLLKLDNQTFLDHAKPFFSDSLLKALEKENQLEKLMPVLRERIETFGDIQEMEEAGEFDYFVDQPEYDIENLLFKKEPDKEATKTRLEHVYAQFEALEAQKWTSESVKDAVWEYASEEGRGAVLWPLRYSLTGAQKSPDPFLVADILGKNETLSRVKKAIELLS